MSYITSMDEATGFLAATSDRSLGTELTSPYTTATPFPHIVIDNFLPEALLDRVLEEFSNIENVNDDIAFDRPQERLKSSFQPETLDDYIRTVFYSFNARPFIRILENITGIRGLIPDPYFMGAGIHEIKQGGHLSIHADFNHHKLMNLERRINVLIYLNKDWRAEYGGSLELWDQAMTCREREILPLFNRCVIFNTTSNSQHGNPQPISHPEGVSRKSIALYYYTSTWNTSKRSHTTQFQVRPNSTDSRDWRIKLLEFKDEILPPFLSRKIRF